ncbi:hypothetical protein LTR85_006937 [Meristemomyces frigidus]|nr:hypothetical protein LTR85_006937 [Meristemomyces frigidus]
MQTKTVFTVLFGAFAATTLASPIRTITLFGGHHHHHPTTAASTLISTSTASQTNAYEVSSEAEISAVPTTPVPATPTAPAILQTATILQQTPSTTGAGYTVILPYMGNGTLALAPTSPTNVTITNTYNHETFTLREVVQTVSTFVKFHDGAVVSPMTVGPWTTEYGVVTTLYNSGGSFGPDPMTWTDYEA